MAHIGNIFNMQHLKATVLESAAQPVGHGECTQVANMNVAVNGGSTRIHLDLARLYRHNLFNLTGQSIVDPHCSVMSSTGGTAAQLCSRPQDESLQRISIIQFH